MRADVRTRHDAPLPFPEGFLWGSGTSAHQVEGGNRHNDWWRFEQQGKVARGETSGEACDHYNRYPDDLALARDLGHGAYKLSIEWSRLEKEPGVADEGEYAHYEQMLRCVREQGLRSFVTLHHFTSPLWLADAGGWLAPDADRRFASFAADAADRLGGLVDHWITINEPMLLALYAYGMGYWPPEIKGWRSAWAAARAMIRGHRLAYAAIRRRLPDADVGIAANAAPLVLSDRPDLGERLLAKPFDWLANLYFLDRVKGDVDFIGLQYYSRSTVRQLLLADVHSLPSFEREQRRSDLGWEIYPRGLHDAVMKVWRRRRVPIYVTENGIADADDDMRAAFVHDHLWWLLQALKEGADVRGYLHWSLMDNFEWLEGFEPRFGLLEVDYETQARKVRDSARYYERICRSNALQPLGERDLACLQPIC